MDQRNEHMNRIKKKNTIIKYLYISAQTHKRDKPQHNLVLGPQGLINFQACIQLVQTNADGLQCLHPGNMNVKVRYNIRKNLVVITREKIQL